MKQWIEHSDLLGTVHDKMADTAVKIMLRKAILTNLELRVDVW